MAPETPETLASMGALTCSKIRYSTEGVAWAAVDEAAAKRHKGKTEASVYRCRRCKGWHLTSRAPRWVRRSQ